MDETEFEFYLWGEAWPVKIGRVTRAEWNAEAGAYIVEDEDGKTYGFPASSVRYYTREDYHYGSPEPSEVEAAGEEEGTPGWNVLPLFPDTYSVTTE